MFFLPGSGFSNLLSFWIITFRVAELRPAKWSEFFFYFSSTFLYLPGPAMKVLDPVSFSPEVLMSNISGSTTPLNNSCSCLYFGNVFGRCCGGFEALLGRLWGRCLGHVWEVLGWTLRGFQKVLGTVVRGQNTCKKPSTCCIYIYIYIYISHTYTPIDP